MENEGRFQRVLGGIAVALAVATVASVLLSRDAPAPEDSALVAPAPAVVLPSENGFSKLESLQNALAQLGLIGSGRHRIPAGYDEANRARADEILGFDLVERLPERLAEILAAPGFQPTATAGEGAAKMWRATIDVIRILRLRMQRHLARGEGEEAWRIAQLGFRFVQLLQQRSTTFHELTLSQASQREWLQAVLAAIDANRWSKAQLRPLAALPDPPGLAARLLEGMRSEYAWLVRSAAPTSFPVGWPRRAVLCQPNRTRRAWLEATAAAVAALRSGDLVRAHQALEVATVRDPIPLRNALGYRLVSGSLAGIATPIAQALDSIAQTRLIKLRAAMALYRLEQGRWPARLAELVGAQLAAVPGDPWSEPVQELRYSAPRRIYSIGSNQRDDGGRFTEDFSHRSVADDYGLRLPE